MWYSPKGLAGYSQFQNFLFWLDGSLVAYTVKRIGLALPTILGIMFLNFLLVHMTPGGPFDMLSQDEVSQDEVSQDEVSQDEELEKNSLCLGRHTTSTTPLSLQHSSFHTRFFGKKTPPPWQKHLEKTYGLDAPFVPRFFSMVKRYVLFDLGDSYFYHQPVGRLIVQRSGPSLVLGGLTVFFLYVLSVALGVYKMTSPNTLGGKCIHVVLMISYSAPLFLVCLLVIVAVGEEGVFPLFPVRGFCMFEGTPNTFVQWMGNIKHFVLPVMAQTLSGLAGLTWFVHNAFVEQANKPYVLGDKAIGFEKRTLIWSTLFPNALLSIWAHMPSSVMHFCFKGSLLTEVIFSIHGLGLLGFDAILRRDYPVIFGLIYVMALVRLLLNIINDVVLAWMDPRLHFGKTTSG